MFLANRIFSVEDIIFIFKITSYNFFVIFILNYYDNLYYYDNLCIYASLCEQDSIILSEFFSRLTEEELDFVIDLLLFLHNS